MGRSAHGRGTPFIEKGNRAENDLRSRAREHSQASDDQGTGLAHDSLSTNGQITMMSHHLLALIAWTYAGAILDGAPASNQRHSRIVWDIEKIVDNA
jgi:hypothetical protein